MALNGKALAVTGVGVLFCWSGIKGWSALGLMADLVSGRQPTGVDANPLVVPGFAEGIGEQTGTQSLVAGGAEIEPSIASIAKQYQGHAYSFGGAPGSNGERPWDCSSFVNFVTGVRLRLAIPGYGPGMYDGSVHGPPTGAWGIWPGLQSVSRQQVASGDIVVWANHMGIALGNNQMISALNSREGTKITPIDGYGNGPLLKYGRYGSVPNPNKTGPYINQPSGVR